MIICFYPGAGGNRFLRYKNHLSYEVIGKSYDHTTRDQMFADRYPIDRFHKVMTAVDDVLTHCVNTPLVKSIWPDKEIYLIDADMQSCLRREWLLHGHEIYQEKTFHDQTERLKKELYSAIRDPSWPNADEIKHTDHLPSHIHDELQQHWANIRYPQPTAEELLRQKYTAMIDSALAHISWHRDYYQNLPLDPSAADHVINLDQDNDFCNIMREELQNYTSDIFDDCWEIVHG